MTQSGRRAGGGTGPGSAAPREPPPWPPIQPTDTTGPRPDRRRPLRPRQIITAVLVALGVGALLSSAALVGLAERQPLGSQRDVALGAANVADRVAHLLSLNRPAAELAAALDGTEEVYDVEALIARARAAAPAASAPPSEPPVPPGTGDEAMAPPADAGGAPADEPAGGAEAASDDDPPDGEVFVPTERIVCVPEDAAAPTTTTGAPGSAPEEPPAEPDPGGDGPESATTDDPGDEASGESGGSAESAFCPPGFVLAFEETDPSTEGTPADGSDPPDEESEPEPEPPLFDAPRVPDEDRPLEMYVGGDSISRDLGEGLARRTPAELVSVELDPRPATGLSRPDFFDWSQHLAGVLTESVPDVIVVLFGANDFQNVAHEGEILDRFGDVWLDLYRERVDRIMTLVSQPDTQTVWVGQPPVREPRLSGGLERLNSVYREVAEQHPQVTFIDTWALFSDDGGGYVDEIDGVRLRREDGVHLTVAGGNRLAEAVWGVIGPAWGLNG